jgi:hypothetical protein
VDPKHLHKAEIAVVKHYELEGIFMPVDYKLIVIMDKSFSDNIKTVLGALFA